MCLSFFLNRKPTGNMLNSVKSKCKVEHVKNVRKGMQTYNLTKPHRSHIIHQWKKMNCTTSTIFSFCFLYFHGTNIQNEILLLKKVNKWHKNKNRISIQTMSVRCTFFGFSLNNTMKTPYKKWKEISYFSRKCIKEKIKIMPFINWLCEIGT